MEKKPDWDAGSRMHILDWVESPQFLPQLQQLVTSTGFTVPPDAESQPKGRNDHRESVLTGTEDPFLSADHQRQLKNWWLVHPHGAKMPTWDLVVTAKDAGGQHGLILVEAKAHSTEMGTGGKDRPTRETPEQQVRSDANHQRIGEAIAEASRALQDAVPGIALTCESNYQFCNRLAVAWKLASLGVPVILLYLGFVGDREINPVTFLKSDADWQATFRQHTAVHFPVTNLDKRIDCGASAFSLVVRSLEVQRPSPPIGSRRNVS